MAIITTQGDIQIAKHFAAGTKLVANRIVLANIPGLDPAAEIDREQGIPTAAHIQWDGAVTREAYVHQDSVVYSLLLDSSIGDFSFNWLGLVTDDGHLLAVSQFITQQKLKTEGSQTGNTFTRNLVLQFSGASTITGINVPASSWQVDYTGEINLIRALVERVAVSFIDSQRRQVEHSHQLMELSERIRLQEAAQ